LPRSFYARPSTDVAPALLGRILVRRTSAGILTARIVEVEAYAPTDPASHAFRGETRRNAVMFGPPGHLYVYFTYGMHHCMNVVTGERGEGSAVLLRAAEPIEGIDAMRAARHRDALRDLCSGPAKLCQAFGVDRSLDGWDLVAGPELWIAEGGSVPPTMIASGPRVGIRVGVDLPWRFRIRDDPWVSRAPTWPVSRSVSSDPSTP
jgi:DNA-3-methyladenine glycosylase